MSRIFEKRDTFKPFEYPWAYNLWLKHEKMHWTGKEVKLHEDIRDWRKKLSQEDRDFLTSAFLLFTQSDIDVAGGYVNDYLPHFQHPELRMMLLGFAAREAVHIDAYSHLLETLGFDDDFYSMFLDIEAMRDKHEALEAIISSDQSAEYLPVKIASISAFTEGMFLFTTFALLLAYPRDGQMKGMGQIVSWSVLDEQIHIEGLIGIFKTIIEENPDWWTDALKSELYSIAELMLALEISFIEEVYKGIKSPRIPKETLIDYAKFIVNRRLYEMGLKMLENGISKNPLPWIDSMINSQNHENFFETRATSYAKGALSGSWGDVWGQYS